MNTQFNPHRTHQAFSLIELLVTVAIIAILASVLISGVQKARASAKIIECTGKLRNLSVAAQSFIAENNGMLPFRVDYNNLGEITEQRSWVKHLGLYTLEGPFLDNDPSTKIFLCPDDPSKNPKQLRTYRYNESNPSLGGASKYGRSNYIPNRISEIASPANHAMLFCVAYVGALPLSIWRYETCIWGKRAETLYPAEKPSEYSRPHYRGDAVNILFYDGHVAKTQYPLPPATYHFDLKPNEI